MMVLDFARVELKNLEVEDNKMEINEEENTDGEYTDYICDSEPYGLRQENFKN